MPDWTDLARSAYEAEVRESERRALERLIKERNTMRQSAEYKIEKIFKDTPHGPLVWPDDYNSHDFTVDGVTFYHREDSYGSGIYMRSIPCPTCGYAPAFSQSITNLADIGRCLSNATDVPYHDCGEQPEPPDNRPSDTDEIELPEEREPWDQSADPDDEVTK